ncbi:unnamed protein product [Trifolium pratense]|uniref:Uncharacterized protein n=1 Tax=Trifolium pratense TaxID=57577 RepID=A0ACB0L307_TRIPR|nr:unnamed protein product [Trifolium pratense]
MKMRSALMVAVYRKQLKLSSSARTRHSAGEIVNYIAVDAYRMGEFPRWFHTAWTSALQIVLSTVILFGVIGIGALPGLVPLLIFGLLNVLFARILKNCQSHIMIAQDKRLRSTSEILNSMKIIKLQSWEEKFKSLVESLHNEEFVWLSKAQILKAFGSFLYWMSPTVISTVVFVGCIVSQSAPLNAETIFTILAALRNMGEPVRMIPEALSIMIQVKVSFDRLNKFFLDEELNNDDSERNFRTKNSCGPVGAGKSSLLYAILGEILKTSGTVNVGGTLAYVSQSSWIQSGTVRDNILFGKPMDKTRYEKAIKACDLDKDINDFIHGDLTEIGQRGINLSGGQKQRIQLARAVYNDADIYLLDDPFSVVDAHTASIPFNIRYRPNAPLVLKGITCTFHEGSRVGVVGRTGSGKSTLISGLFRLVEPSTGDILIDGINICSIGLKDLRTKLCIIPQEPTLFKGSIRTNLEPLGLYSDDEIWKVVEKCQLKETIDKLPSLLDSSVSDEGGNWSLGERQLICLGRVLLKRNRILVLDEATASIDSATDAILQRVIRQEFAECTVITVAHRIPTVIDSDMVMVLSYGKLVEYDEPSKLMDTNSSFSKLVTEYWSSCRKNSFTNIISKQPL